MRKDAEPGPGACLGLPLSEDPSDVAEVTVMASVRRDLIPRTDPGSPLEIFDGALLVEVSVAQRVVIPGAWADPSIATLERFRHLHPADPARLRLPAVVLGEADDAVLAWGETLWPLPLDGSVRIPDSCRPGIHRAAELRRLTLCALGRQAEVALTRWRSEDFEVPWHDARMAPNAAWWFDVAQVPPGMRYADAARTRSVPVERFELENARGEGTTR